VPDAVISWLCASISWQLGHVHTVADAKVTSSAATTILPVVSLLYCLWYCVTTVPLVLQICLWGSYNYVAAGREVQLMNCSSYESSRFAAAAVAVTGLCSCCAEAGAAAVSA
jgi:hypothetical protein